MTISAMKNLSIITARGGSKRIPRKNIKDFMGKPIIAYSIKTAIESNLFEEVMVSTDDNEIATISQSYGAKVPFLRSAENSDDYSGTADVLMEVIYELHILCNTFCEIRNDCVYLHPRTLTKGYYGESICH